MNKYFLKNKKLLERAIVKAIKLNQKSNQKINPWAKDALDRLAEFALRGKLIRGQLVLLAADSGNGNSAEALAVASSLEIFHTSILVHDDIMDRDLKRRGLPTIHAQYMQTSQLKDKAEALHFGESMASSLAIIGYFLGMGNFANISDAKISSKILDLYSEEMALLGMAQMDDVNLSTHQSASNKAAVFRVYEQKTGRYTFAVPLLSGFILKGKDSAALRKVVFELAKHLGIIFQLRDDILGVFGKSAVTGKSVGGDIRERKQTWLYFTLLELVNKKEKSELQKLYQGGKALNLKQQQLVKNLMVKYDILAKSEQELEKQYTIIKKFLPKLPLSANCKVAFDDLIKYLMTREK